MMAAELSRGDTEELTSQQKYQRIRPKMTVEVRLVSAAGSDAKWVEARVADTNKGGAFCKLLNSPLERFWHWSDVRLSPSTLRTAPTTATMGEILRAHTATEQPRREPLPAPPALASALAARTPPSLASIRAIQPDPEKTPGGGPAEHTPPSNFPPKAQPISRPAPILISREELRLAETDTSREIALPLRVSRSPLARNTEIGLMIKSERLRRQLPQLDLAQLMNKSRGGTSAVYNSRISRIEFGKSLPDDDELVAFAEVLKLDLDQCIAARDRDRAKRVVDDKERDAARATEERQRKDRERKKAVRDQRRQQRHELAAAEGRIIHERPGALVDRPPAELAPRPEKPGPGRSAFRAAAPSRSGFADLSDLVEALIEIVPMPLDAELRKAWFRCAKELFRLSGGE